MGELVRASDITGHEDVGKVGPQHAVVRQRARRIDFDAERLQAKPADVGGTSKRNQDSVEFDGPCFTIALAYQRARRARAVERFRTPAGHDVHAIRTQACFDDRSRIGVFACQQPVVAFDQHHVAAQPRKRLTQFAPDRAAPQHDETTRKIAQSPEGFRCQHVDPVDARQRWHGRSRTGRDHQATRGQAATVDLDFPWRHHLRVAQHHVDTQPAVALGRIVRGDACDRGMHAVHRAREIDIDLDPGQSVALRRARMCDLTRSVQQGLGWHAAGVEAVTAHAIAFDEGDFRLGCRRDVCGDQSG